MFEPDTQTDPGEAVLEAINSITANKNRPNLARIFSHLHKTRGFSLSRCENILDALLRDGKLVRINHLGNVIYMSPNTFKKNRNKVIAHEAQDRIQETALSVAIASLALKNPSYLDVGAPQKVIEDFILAIGSENCRDADDVDMLIERELDYSIVRLENGNFLYKVKPPRAGCDSVSVQDDSDEYIRQRELNFENKVKEMLISEQRSSVNNKAPDTELNKTIDKKNTKQKPNKNATKELAMKKKSQTRLKEISTVNKKQKLEAKKKSTEKSCKLSEPIGRIKSCEPVYQCFLCKIYGCTTPSEPMVTCNNCNMRGHPICIVKEQRLVLNIPYDLNVWQCSKCRKDETPKPKTDDDGPSCALSVTPSYKNIQQQHQKPDIAKGLESLFKPLKCSICQTKGGEMVVCNTCPKLGHPFCIKKQMELGSVTPRAVNDWQCPDCKTNETGEKIPTCVLCNSPKNLMKNLIKCRKCFDYYHKKCHNPQIDDSDTAHWKCMKCIRKDCDNALAENDEIELRKATTPPSKKKHTNSGISESVINSPDNRQSLENDRENGSNVRFNDTVDIEIATHENNISKILKDGERNAKKIEEDENCNVFDADLMMYIEQKLFENGFLNEIKALNLLNTKFNYLGKGPSPRKHEIPNEFFDNIDKSLTKLRREAKQTANLNETKEMDESATTGRYCQSKPNEITDNWSLALRDRNGETPSDKLKGEIEERPFPDLEVPDPTYWSIEDVYGYFLEYFDEEVAKTFVEMEIDGCALKLLKKSDVIKRMGFKLGIGLQVLLHVKRLQIRTNDRRIIWNLTV